MNRRRTFTLSAFAALGSPYCRVVSSPSGNAQAQFIGTWTIVSYETTLAEATARKSERHPHVRCRRAICVMGGADRPKFKSASQPTRAELAAAMEDYFAGSAGTWAPCEADKTSPSNLRPLYVPIMRGRISKAPSPSSGMN
jgi:hypothetical protein